ncbi:MAG: pilus assembly protein N-terminal domain-containing protein [Hyphomicrobiales bacterium]
MYSVYGEAKSPHRGKGRVRRAGAALVALAMAAGTLALMIDVTPARAGDPITVVVDRAKILRLTEPAGTIVLGNPAIADATMPDDRTLVLTGKSYGSTNLVILDGEGRQIADEVILVRAPQDAVVTVYKGVNRETLSCAPVCQQTATVGDKTEVFTLINSQTQTRNTLSQAQAGTGGMPGPQ